MPGVKKYSVQVANRFALDSAGDSSSSDDESSGAPVAAKKGWSDPFDVIRQVESTAAKNAKDQIKAQQKAASEAKKVQAKEQAKEKKETAEKKPVRNNRREPRGNNQPRRGPRNERSENKEGEMSFENSEFKGKGGLAKEGDAKRPPRRNKERQSGSARTGVKPTEKRGGGGARNWGDATENPEDHTQVTEKTTDENAENTDPKKVDEEKEEVEDVEKEPETFTFEEYMAQQSAATAGLNQPTKLRQANDGNDEIKGTALRKKQLFDDGKHQVTNQADQPKKAYVAMEKTGFKSAGRRGGFGDRRGGRGEDRAYGDGPRNNNRSQKAPQFSIKKDEFPSLGA